MKRKGEMDTTKVVAGFILILIVLFVLAFIFKDQVGKSLASILNIGENAEQGAKNQRCESIISNRKCNPTYDDFDDWDWEKIPEPSEGWIEDKCKCYERRV